RGFTPPGVVTHRAGRGFPRQLRAVPVGAPAGEPDFKVERRLRRHGHRRHRDGVETRDVCQVIEIHPLDHITVAHAIFYPYDLMLTIVILIRFGETYRRITLPEERLLVTTAPETVRAVNGPYVKILQVFVCERRHVARNIARGRIRKAPKKPGEHCLLQRLVALGAFGIHAYRVRVVAS